MKYYMHCHPAGDSSHPVYMVLSDKAILAEYYNCWYDRLRVHPHILDRLLAAKPEDMHKALYLEQLCIEDWCVCNWATEATPEALISIIEAPNPDNSAP